MNIDDFMNHDFNITHISLTFIKGCAKNSYGRLRADYGLTFYPDGGYIFRFSNGVSLKTGKNTVLFNPKGAAYDIEVLENRDCWSIVFDLDENPDCEPFVVSIRDAAYIQSCFRDAEKMFRQAQPGYIMSCKAKVCEIIALMQKEYTLGYISGENCSVITPATEKIYQCYTSVTPTVPELASLCGITPEYFRMLFKKKHGQSPVKFINNLRLSRARELLYDGGYTVTEVATLSGFSELPYFCREFKKKYGITPSELLKSNGSERF